MFRRLAIRFQRFMTGRRGLDTLGYTLIFVSLFFSLLSNFFFHPFLRGVLWLLQLASLVWLFVRFFSRDIAARERENARLRAFYAKLRSFWRTTSRRVRERKTHVYFKCTGCKNTLRVPKGRGNITVTCPVCHEQIKKRT